MTEEGDQKSTEKQSMEQTHNDTWYLITVKKKILPAPVLHSPVSLTGSLLTAEEYEKKLLKTVPPVMGIRTRMFLGLPDPEPDPLVRGTDLDPNSSLFIIMLTK